MRAGPLQFSRSLLVEIQLIRDLDTQDHELRNPVVSTDLKDKTSARNSGFERMSK